MSQFPFLSEFLTEKFGTLYVLSDSVVRLRDAVSVVALVRFFTAHGVRVDVQPVLARHRRFLSAIDVAQALRKKELRATLEDLRRSQVPLDEFVRTMFRHAEVEDREDAQLRELETPLLAPRGPVLVLGRPQIYPEMFQMQIHAELRDAKRALVARFVMPYPEEPAERPAGAEGEQGTLDDPLFWQVDDTYFGIERSTATTHNQLDYGIVRKIRGAFSRRTFLFAYGTSSLGTLGTAQALVDKDQNERLAGLDLDRYFHAHGEVEVLIEVQRRADRAVTSRTLGDQQGELTPAELRVAVGPAAPVSPEARDWIALFTGNADNDPRLRALYAPTLEPGAPDVRRFTVAPRAVHPESQLAPRMIGGERIERCLAALVALGKNPEDSPILLVGPTGVGKELAAQVIFEARVRQMIARLAEGRPESSPPAVVGARFGPENCAAITQTLAESQLFGITRGAATGTSPRPGRLLSAGEGIAFLDEMGFMSLEDQGRLLRVMQHPFALTPVGADRGTPIAARIVCATSRDPDELVNDRLMLPELLARFGAAVVKIPTVAERPGDIPALLATLAERPVRMDENVLRCLLADPHPANARGINAIVARARAARSVEDDDAAAPLHITLGMLGTSADLVEHFQLPTAATPRVFEFSPPRHPALPFDLFASVATVLTSLGVGPVSPERAETGQTAGEPDEPSGFSVRAPSGYLRREGIPDPTSQTVSSCFDLWTDIVRELHRRRRTDGMHAAWLQEVGGLCGRRFPGHRRQFAEALTSRLRRAQRAQAGAREKGQLYAQDLAGSIGVDRAFYSRSGSSE